MLKKNIKIDRKSMELISLFNNISGAIVKDCLIFETPENYDNEKSEVIIFLVKKDDIGKAIGKSGEHVKDLMTKLQKKIDVIPFSSDISTFIQFILNTSKSAVKVQNIEIKENKNDKRTVVISVRPQDRGKAIGKDGSMIRKIKTLVLRHYDVDNVIINTHNA
ncbi:MAG: NusA-like transcription termination signal-binding factor [Candidatus Lokiarchaeota archaeon]|nr:NusA-like transcription termination signal-binding factor [Candidatus Lokiarchaeota archaeon]